MTRSGPRPPRAAMDWAKIHEQIEALGRTIEGTASLSPEEIQSELEERARALATPLRKDVGEATLELITFEFAGEAYAVESHYVIEVFRPGDTALLPGAEPPVVGITVWRGELLPLFSLRQMLGLTGSAEDSAAHVLVLGENRPAFGIPVSAVRELRRTPSSAVRSSGETDAPVRGFVKGMTVDAVVVLAAGELVRTFG